MASSNFLALTDHLARAGINFAADSFKMLLVSAAPSEANLDTWANRSDVSNEVSGAGYTAGGVAIALTVGSLDSANNRLAITAANLAPGWTSATITAVGAIIYKSTGNAATDKLVAFVDFGGTVSSTNGNFVINFSAPLYINR